MSGMGRLGTSARSAAAVLALTIGLGAPVSAAGLLDASCSAAGQKHIVTDVQGGSGRGHAMAAFVRGKDAAGADSDYMMLVWSVDGGAGNGGLSFYDWDQAAGWLDPPTLRFKLADARLREAHSTPVTNMFANDWRTWVLQATNGFSVYDLDSVAAPRLVRNRVVPDAQPSGYNGGAIWFLALAAPYLYVAQADEGLRIYKFTNPANPSQIALQRTYDTDFFGHRVNQVWVRGNRIVVAAVEKHFGLTIADISDPLTLAGKVRYGQGSTPPIRDVYSWTLNGTSLYAATKAQDAIPPGMAVYEFDPASWALQSKKEVAGECSTGAYVALQDDNVLIGLSTCVHKIRRDTKGSADPSDDSFARVSPPPPNVTPPPPPWTIGIAGADHDFTTPFGNAVFVGNDHERTPGSMVLCHAAAADNTRPRVNGRNPVAGATGVATTAAVGLSFSDNLKPWTVNRNSLTIRVKSTQAVVEGYYSYQLNTVNFRPVQPFAPGTEYEVLVKNAIKDLAGNGAVTSTATFTTGP
jgi:hypothetical protein